MPPWLAAMLPHIVQGGASIFNTILGNKSAKKNYQQQQEYNSPAQQMQRFQQAGLSPYLMYGQGSNGNASAPAPQTDYGLDKIGGNIGDYIAMSNLSEDLKTKRLNNSLLLDELRNRKTEWEGKRWENVLREINGYRKALDMQSKYPGFKKSQQNGQYVDVNESNVSQSIERQLLQLKRAATEAAIEQTQTRIQGMRYDNKVKRVKGIYADEYGMVGGDWTQGLGLVKSLLSRRKTNVYQNQLRKQFKK